MTLFVMTRQRYEILCALRTEAHTVNELQAALSIPHYNTCAAMVIALRNAKLIEFRGFRHTHGAPGPRPVQYILTQLGEAAIQATRVQIAVQDRAFVDLEKLEVAA